MTSTRWFQLLALIFLVCRPAAAELIEGASVTNSSPHENISPHLASDRPAIDAPVKIVSVFGTHSLKVYPLPFADSFPSGPFEILGHNRFLFVSKCGDVYFTRLETELHLLKPAKRLLRPSGGDTHAADGSHPQDMVYCKDSSGVKDSLLVNDSLFVAYVAWDEQQNGARLAVSEFALDADHLELRFKREIFLSHPAIKEPMLGMQAGGKLALGEDDRTLYIGIGDFSKPESVQDHTSSLGKVIRVDLPSLEAEVYASGIRSPSGGLLYDRASEELWLTDHGPRGGDEVNRIQKNGNYGWPVVSYGTMYERDGMGGYYGNQFNNHENFEKPAMTFVPSIGIGPIAKYPSTGRNDYWEDDYFVAGMASATLLRIRKEGTRLIYAEPVLTGYRIRAMKIDKHGNFYLKTDANQFLVSE